jgi:hypothetical protein
MLLHVRVPLRRRKRTIFDWLLFVLALGAIVGVSWATVAVRPGHSHDLVTQRIDRAP